MLGCLRLVGINAGGVEGIDWKYGIASSSRRGYRCSAPINASQSCGANADLGISGIMPSSGLCRVIWGLSRLAMR